VSSDYEMGYEILLNFISKVNYKQIVVVKYGNRLGICVFVKPFSTGAVWKRQFIR